MLLIRPWNCQSVTTWNWVPENHYQEQFGRICQVLAGFSHSFCPRLVREFLHALALPRRHESLLERLQAVRTSTENLFAHRLSPLSLLVWKKYFYLFERNNSTSLKEILLLVWKKYIYSCPNLVLAKMKELISRPFVGQIQFQLVLLKRIETESAVGCLVFLSRSLFLFPRSLPAQSCSACRLTLCKYCWKDEKYLWAPKSETAAVSPLERVQNFQRASNKWKVIEMNVFFSD